MEIRLMGLHIHNETDVTNRIDASVASLATPPATCASCANPSDLVPSWTTVVTMHSCHLPGDDTHVRGQLEETS